MAGQDHFLLTGGNSQPTLGAVSSSMGRAEPFGGGGIQPHHGILGVLIVALIGLWALDHFGFRFAVTAGNR